MNPSQWLRDRAHEYAADAERLRRAGLADDAPMVEAVALELRACADELEAACRT